MNSLVDRSGWHLRSPRGLHVGYLQADTEFARCALASAAERTELLKDWANCLGDVTMARTVLARLMHRCAMLEFEGKSGVVRAGSMGGRGGGTGMGDLLPITGPDPLQPARQPMLQP